MVLGEILFYFDELLWDVIDVLIVEEFKDVVVFIKNILEVNF